MPLHVAYVTRKYPPAIGGSENFSYQLSRTLASRAHVSLIAWPSPRLSLPLFYGHVMLSLLKIIRGLSPSERRGRTIVHFGDAALSPLAAMVRGAFHVPVTITAHGYELTYPNPIYQRIVHKPLEVCDAIICDSKYMASYCESRGIPVSKLHVVSLGVSASEYHVVARTEAERHLQTRLPPHLDQRNVLLTIGRLVERKGVLCFVENVMPGLVKHNPKILYWVIGSGPQRDAIRRAIAKKNLDSHVYLWGTVDTHTIRCAATLAQLFVAPNVPVEANPEGFGLVTLEARAMGLPVIVANVDGLAESVMHGHDGWVVKGRCVEDFADTICRFFAGYGPSLAVADIRKRIVELYSWDRVALDYMRVFEEAVGGC